MYQFRLSMPNLLLNLLDMNHANILRLLDVGKVNYVF